MVEELIPIFFFMCVAGVMILRPVTKKLGLLIEAMAKERMGQNGSVQTGLDETQLERITVALERLNTRIDRVDDRMNFMEHLVEDRNRRQRLTG
ncbi:MAG: hypothetical protein ACN0LA_08250 [Candidatus Longimicrobiales bacterium M2_2A_002]